MSADLAPDMSLGAIVTWSTEQPAHSEVSFSIEGKEFRVVLDDLVTEHRVFVVGLRAESTYTLTVSSTTASATGSESIDVTTGSLPDNLPDRASVVTGAGEQTARGHTLMNYWDGGQAPALAIILDPEGYPVWFFESGPADDRFGATSTEWTYDGTVLIGPTGNTPAREIDLEGHVLWEGPSGGDGSLSHDTHKLRSGNYLVVRESASTARIEEVDAENAVVWSWDLYADSSVDNAGVNDWCHLNSVSTDATERFVFINCRFQGLFKIDKQTGQLIFQLGAAMDANTTGDMTYLPDNSVRFNDAHDPEVHEDGTVLLYDNQGWANRMVGEKNGNYRSQVVEYQLNEDSKQASLSWAFPGNFSVETWYTESWSTPIWGDSDRLENDNVLITAGITGTNTGGMTPAGTRTRIFEVTRDGQVVWAVEWPEGIGTYRAERIQLPIQQVP